MKKRNRYFEIILTALLIVVLSPIIMYTVAYVLKSANFIVQIGTIDTWIGFVGSIIGGTITMLALFFTLKDDQKKYETDYINSIKPYISCTITNCDEQKEEVIVKNDFEDEQYKWGFIECQMKNISNNIANYIQIKEEYSYVVNKNGVYEKYDKNNKTDYGIDIYTVIVNDGRFLAPGECYNWKTNCIIELNKDGSYKWEHSAIGYRHTIVFEYTDIYNIKTYTQNFDFEININVDTDNKLHFFLWNIGNSINTQQEIR